MTQLMILRCPNEKCQESLNSVPSDQPYCRRCGSILSGDHLLKGQYELLSLISSRQRDRTIYSAIEHLQEITGSPLKRLIKRFNLNQSTSSFRAYENESKVLQVLSSTGIHGIPAFHNCFLWGDENIYDRSAFIVVQYVSGENLKDWIDKLTLPLENESINKITEIFLSILDVVSELHSNEIPIVHRDIKPENVLVSRDNVWLVDFGAAQLGDDFGAEYGTPEYMPREQRPDEKCRAAVDIYATGVSLFHALVGAQRFSEFLGRARAEKRLGLGLTDDDIPLSIPQAYRQVLINSTAQDWRDRYSSAGEFARQLRGCLTSTLNLPAASNSRRVLAHAVSRDISLAETMPFDLTLVWGLEQGRFIGILHTMSNSSVFEELASMELRLRRSAEERMVRVPPYRNWLYVAIDELPTGPDRELDLLRVGKWPEWKLESTSGSVRTSGIPGFVLGARKIQKGNLPSLVIWCQRLLRLFDGKPIAIVIELDARSHLRGLVRSQIAAAFPQITLLDEFSDVAWETINHELPVGNQFDIPGLGKPFCSWIELLRLRNHSDARIGNLGAKYPAVLEVYDQLRSTEVSPKEYDALQVMDDLEQFFEKKSNKRANKYKQLNAQNTQNKEKLRDSSNYENKVFVSYSWGDESENIVDELETAFAERGIEIIRDKKHLSYKESIQLFEQRIAQGQCIVLIIGSKYLQSKHCMYELVEAERKQNLRERIFPIVLTDAQIFDPMDRLSYIKYWDQQIAELNGSIKGVDRFTNLTGITDELANYEQIRANFDHLTDLLRDMNTLTVELHANNRYLTLIDMVEKALMSERDIVSPIEDYEVDEHAPGIPYQNLRADFEYQFLQLVEEVMPEKIAELIFAYAQSSNLSTRKTSLLFLTDKKNSPASWFPSTNLRFDCLMDSWLQGVVSRNRSQAEIEVDLNLLSSTILLQPAFGQKYVQALVLAAMRLPDLQVADFVIRHILEDNDEIIEKQLREILKYYRSQPDERKQIFKQWLLQPSGDLFALALRANIFLDNVKLMRRFLMQTNLLDLDFWWLVTAQLASEELLECLVSLPPAKRAIFGLINEHETQIIEQMGIDEREQLVDCRRGRKLAT